MMTPGPVIELQPESSFTMCLNQPFQYQRQSNEQGFFLQCSIVLPVSSCIHETVTCLVL